tara:strand:- start:276 stop:416 length:141 start_codon:yes stop_codon:yes gene_type:complete
MFNSEINLIKTKSLIGNTKLPLNIKDIKYLCLKLVIDQAKVLLTLE